MLALSRIISFFALWVLRREWKELRVQLAKLHRSYAGVDRFRPTTLAQQLLILGEDHRFFSHGGIDPIAICRAIWRGVFLSKPEGASTIEMQIIRVVSGRYQRTLRRKIREIGLATLVCREVPKEALPALYLRIGYFGWRMNGYEAACRRLGVSPEELTPNEAARLVARLKYPQPRFTGLKRWNQINVRAEHLLRLHSLRKYGQTHIGLAKESPYESV
jgi:membrane carboxypeptidase/penicillin-binding protein PbpC